jgi:rSAM/selenodomain-associated transferase 2
LEVPPPPPSAALPPISVIIPALEEEQSISGTIESCRDPAVLEVIVVDGGSRDRTADRARQAGAQVAGSAAGRAVQMNCGAHLARGKLLLFLHADTRLAPGFGDEVVGLLGRPDTAAGAFTLKIDGPGWSLRIIEAVAGLRARRLGLPYGDQVLFMRSDLFHRMGGFPELPIMEDFVLVRRLSRFGRIRISPLPARTSARRWERAGPWRTTLANQLAVTGFLLGIPPADVAAWYRRFTRG